MIDKELPDGETLDSRLADLAALESRLRSSFGERLTEQQRAYFLKNGTLGPVSPGDRPATGQQTTR